MLPAAATHFNQAPMLWRCPWFMCDKMFFAVHVMSLQFTVKKSSKNKKKKKKLSRRCDLGQRYPLSLMYHTLQYTDGRIGFGTELACVSLCCRRANCTDPLHLSLTLFAPPANIPPFSLPPPLSHDLHGLSAGPVWSAHITSGFYKFLQRPAALAVSTSPTST